MSPRDPATTNVVMVGLAFAVIVEIVVVRDNAIAVAGYRRRAAVAPQCPRDEQQRIGLGKAAPRRQDA